MIYFIAAYIICATLVWVLGTYQDIEDNRDCLFVSDVIKTIGIGLTPVLNIVAVFVIINIMLERKGIYNKIVYCRKEKDTVEK